MAKSNVKSRSRKSVNRPKRPYPEYPLGAHVNGRWQKRIKGQLYYFGRWGRMIDGAIVQLEGDEWWKPALEIFKAQIDGIQAGHGQKQIDPGKLTVKQLCDRFYTAKLRQLEKGEITPRTLSEYDATCARLCGAFGRDRPVEDLTANDFELLRAGITWGPVRLGNEITKIKTVFKYGYEAAHLDKPMRYGPQFKKPSKAILRKNRAEGGKRLFSPEEIRQLLDVASVPMRGMLLLGINCAFGGNDCGTLPLSAVDLDNGNGWIEYARPKTGIERRCPLWPETVAALRQVIAERPAPKLEADAELVFVTKYGKAWASDGKSNAVTQEMGKLLRKLEINGRRGLGHYSLRHSFRTIADATRDPNAIRKIMGHTDGSIDDAYTHGIDNARLEAVSNFVHDWLFGAEGGDA